MQCIFITNQWLLWCAECNTILVQLLVIESGEMNKYDGFEPTLS